MSRTAVETILPCFCRSDLGQAMGGAAQAGGVFEAVCFVENTRTNTQCGIWRQEESRTLVLSFRGTQQDAIADIITDLSFAQQPATLKAHEVTVSTPEEVLDAAAKLEDALAEALACVRAGDLEEAVLRAAEVEELRAALEEALRTQEAPPEGEAAAEDEEEREQQGAHDIHAVGVTPQLCVPAKVPSLSSCGMGF